jgi:hypothetical protein
MEPTSQRPKVTPKDFFVYLGIAVTLYVSAGSLLALLFAVINIRFPDAIDYGYYYAPTALEALRFPLSALLVMFPLFLFLSWYVRKELARDRSKIELWVRRWFVWLTLFAAGATLVGDVIALVSTFLGGEITVRFILKMLSVLVVAGAVFGYYFYDLRRTARGDVSVNKPLIIVAALFILGSIVLGFVAIGSPARQRALRFDKNRVFALQELQNQVLYHWQQTQRLPASLDDLSDDLSGFIVPSDPETGAPYEYRATGPLSFELCADFSLASAADAVAGKASPRSVEYPGDALDPRFEHDAGTTCFTRTIDPVKHPPFKR